MRALRAVMTRARIALHKNAKLTTTSARASERARAGWMEVDGGAFYTPPVNKHAAGENKAS